MVPNRFEMSGMAAPQPRELVENIAFRRAQGAFRYGSRLFESLVEGLTESPQPACIACPISRKSVRKVAIRSGAKVVALSRIVRRAAA